MVELGKQSMVDASSDCGACGDADSIHVFSVKGVAAGTVRLTFAQRDVGSRETEGAPVEITVKVR